MIYVKLAILVPVVLLLLVGVKAGNNTETPPTNSTGGSPVSVTSNGTASTQTIPTFTVSSTGFGPMLRRLLIVTAVVTSVVGIYFIVKFCRSGKRKARKYGVVKTPGDHETRPLESDYDDDDEDVTMFDRRN